VVNRVERKNQAVADDIVRAAAELMAEGGVDAVTLEALSQRADVAVQTIYNRVGNRAAVLLRVAERAFEANQSYLDAAYASTGSAADRIRAVARAYASFAREKPDEYRLLAFPAHDEPMPDRLVELIDEQNSRLAALLDEAVAAGSARADLDTSITAVLLWRIWDGVLGLQFRRDRLRTDDAQLTQVLDTLESLVELGLRSR
jgi:AcrR family transcriptional regulator